MFFEGHENLGTKSTGKIFRNFAYILSKNIYLIFFICHFARFQAPYIYSCSLQQRLSFSIKIIGIANKRMNGRQFDLTNSF